MQNKTPDEIIDTKQKILRAAAKIINTTGVLSLTLESVAKEAKISKGGLLYHFPNKNTLMKGMAEYLIQGFNNEVVRAANKDSCEKGKWTRAYTTITFNQLDDEFDMNVAILAAMAMNPELLESISKHLKVLQVRIENDHIDSIVSTIIRLAVDGIYFNHLYGMSLRKDVHKKVLDYLISLTKEVQ
jgi:AcrR family transcriptional regulator